MARTIRTPVTRQHASVNYRRVRHHNTRVAERSAYDALVEAGARVPNRVGARARGTVLPNDRDDSTNAAWDEVAHRNSDLRPSA